jgi:hypothetical protein
MDKISLASYFVDVNTTTYLSKENPMEWYLIETAPAINDALHNMGIEWQRNAANLIELGARVQDALYAENPAAYTTL